MADEPQQIEMFSPTELSDTMFDSSVMSRIKDDENAGQYTASRLRKSDPSKFSAVRAMLGANVPMVDIASILGLHFYTVSAIAEQEADYIAQAKDKLAKKAFTISTVALERVAEAMPNVRLSKPEDIYKIALTAANLAEKGTLLSGGATQRIEHVESQTYESAEDFEKSVFGDPIDV